MDTNLVQAGSKFDELCANIQRSGKEYSDYVALAILSAFSHIREHRDSSGMSKLVKSIQKRDVPALKRFILAFDGFVTDKVSGTEKRAIMSIDQKTGNVILVPKDACSEDEYKSALNIDGMSKADWRTYGETTEVSFRSPEKILEAAVRQWAKTIVNTEATEDTVAAMVQGSIKTALHTELNKPVPF